MASQGKLMLFGALRRREAPKAERVVVFVHGLMAAGAVFDPMRAHLERSLGVATVDYTYVPLRQFERVARRFATFLDHELPRPIRLSLVGHSFGGLLVRWYVQELGGADRVDRVVLLATPNAGTTSARFAIGPVLSAIKPGSPILTRLAASRSVAEAIPHDAIVAGRDLMCSPPASAGAIEKARVTVFDELGHNEMLFDRRVFDTVHRALT